MEIPTFMGGKNILKEEWGEYIILDTYSEEPVVITNPSVETLREYRVLQTEYEKEKEEIKKLLLCPL